MAQMNIGFFMLLFYIILRSFMAFDSILTITILEKHPNEEQNISFFFKFLLDFIWK